VVKASLRTQRDDVNTAKIAAAFGGGGHVKAAGFAVPGRLEQEVRWNVLPVENNSQ
jgi:nanoRNase/pAp phosphatase (c-di-AMP/oligoRNAs hydrolase)